MKITIVCGLLGSGKTTFIRNYLKDRAGKAVVLVNDFGQAGIDGEIISAGGIEAIELPSGCVCCTLRVDLITSVQKVIARFSPEHLLIEPSGVASPLGVLEALESARAGPASVIGIVDAVEFAELYGSGMYGSFFREQIESSDIILVNKSDIAARDAIAAAEELITGINPHAVLVRTVNAVIEHPLPIRERPAPGDIGQGAGVRGNFREHFRFETHSFTVAQGFPLALFQKLIDDLARGTYGNVVRAKALVRTSEGPYRFDVVYGKVDAARFEQEISDSRLVVIGEGLEEEGIGKGLVPW